MFGDWYQIWRVVRFLAGNNGSHLPARLKFQSGNVQVTIKESFEDMHVRLSESQPKTHHLPFMCQREIAVDQSTCRFQNKSPTIT